MARLATLEDFEQGGLYEQYRRYPFFATRAQEIGRRFPTTGAKVLVAGCGWGYLVDELVSLGFDAYGVDASQYAIDRAATAVPNVANRIFIGNCTVPADMAGVRSLAGLKTNQKFTVTIQEDMFPCLTDAEITDALAALRGVSTNLFHIVTAGSPTDWYRVPGLNWKSHEDWKTLVGTEFVMNAEGGAIL